MASVATTAAERETAESFAALVASEPECLHRHCRTGHLTASAWVVDRGHGAVLLTHHRKLDRWLQLGGHVDGDPDLRRAAAREAREEAGLASLAPVGDAIFDLDRHRIPARGDEPEHWHYDVRYVFSADANEPLRISDESHALAWVALPAVAALNPSESLARMVRKTPRAGQR